MSYTIKTDNMLGEKLNIFSLPTGGKCYIIPKYGFKKTMAVISFNYGSSHLRFILNGEKIQSPNGTAHFLEHRMFEKKNKSYLSYFSDNGAEVNAFTDFGKTAYYFSSTENFYENLKNLGEMVSNFFCDEKSIETEKSIIEQEISMYNDNPYWCAYFNMLKCMYHNHPIRYSVAGKASDIQDINVGTLEEAYKSFYVSKNINVIICGDVSSDLAIDTLLNSFSSMFKENEVGEKIRFKESANIKEKFIKESKGLTLPVFNIGFKQKWENNNIKKIYGMKILLDIILGSSSYLFSKLQSMSYLSESLSFQYIWGDDIGLSVITGQSHQPKIVGNALIREIKRLQLKGLDEEVFNRIKKKHIGRFIRGFNSVQGITLAQAEISNLDSDLIAAFHCLKEMQIEYVESLIYELEPTNAVLSIID